MPNDKRQKLPPHLLKQFKSQIENQIDSHVGIVDEIADLLNISKESVYRRFRGDSSLSLDEVYTIISTYSFSMDALFGSKQVSATFEFTSVANSNSKDYILKVISYFNAFENDIDKNTVILAAHVPIHRFLPWKALIRFKIDLWTYKNQNPYTNELRFEIGHLSGKLTDVLPTTYTEVWSIYTVVSFLQEIDYAVECELLFSKDDLFDIFTELVLLIKQLFYATPTVKLYQSEIPLQVNVMASDGSTILWLADDIVGYAMHVVKPGPLKQWTEATLKQSVKISGQSMKQKKVFYHATLNLVMISASKLLSENQVVKLELITKP